MARLAVLAAVAGCLAVATAEAAEDQLAFFEKRVRPILVNHCYGCHGPEEASAGLRLDSRAGWQAGSENGPVLVVGKPDESRIIRAVRYADPDLQMPPPDEGGQLTDRQIADLVYWITIGAPDPREGRPATVWDFETARAHWAFLPIKQVDPPDGLHPVDYFVERELSTRGYTPLRRADTHTLICANWHWPSVT